MSKRRAAARGMVQRTLGTTQRERENERVYVVALAAMRKCLLTVLSSSRDVSALHQQGKNLGYVQRSEMFVLYSTCACLSVFFFAYLFIYSLLNCLSVFVISLFLSVCLCLFTFWALGIIA